MEDNSRADRVPDIKSFEIDKEKTELIKRTICKGSTDDELQLFVHACNKSGLDPFMRQIFAVKRWDSSAGRSIMTIQTGIDGYRLIADRTGKYTPGRDTEFGYDKDGNLKWAKSYIKKMTLDGQWHEVSGIAFWEEYVQRTKDGKPTSFWKSKAHIMLSKCAEALVLRKTFPAELSGLYTQEEMSQSFPNQEEKIIEKVKPPKKMVEGEHVEEKKTVDRMASFEKSKVQTLKL